jgi:malate dehydrogenase (quinone)
MSATLGLILKELQPDIKIEIYERLDMAPPSSDAWNNAGTGHSAFVNSIILQKAMMVVLIPKAISIAESLKFQDNFTIVQQNKVST